MLWMTLRQLKSSDDATRIKAVHELGKLPAEQAVDYLLPVLSDTSYEVRLAVVRTLGKFDDKCAVEPLLMALNDRFASVRQEAIAELSKFNADITVAPLVAALSDNDEGVRCAALKILELIQAPEAARALADHQELVQEIHEQQSRREPFMRMVDAENEVIRVEKDTFESQLRAATPGAYVTHVLIGLNIAIFIIMTLRGAGLVVPNTDVMIRWGANFAPLTTQGEWWRLVTCAFLHFGIIHIALNMWVLLRGGIIIEKLFGNVFFLLIYMTSAVTCSLLSLAVYRDNAVVAGASGAIFGIYGALLAYLLLHKTSVPKTVLRPLMKSTISFIAYNLLIGFGIAGIGAIPIGNAGHIGGLIGGFLVGLIVARPLDLKARISQTSRKMAIGTTGAVLSIVLVCIVLPKSAYSYKDEVVFSNVARAFSEKEKQAIAEWNDLSKKQMDHSITVAEMADKLESDCLTVWQDYNKQFSSIKLTDKSPSYKMQQLAVDYTKTRADATQCLIEGLRTNNNEKYECYTTLELTTKKLIEEIKSVAAKK